MQECCRTSNIIALYDPLPEKLEVGGKAEKLNFLHNLGFRVPYAFFITTQFFYELAQATQTKSYIETQLGLLNRNNVKDIAENIKNKILSIAIPSAYARLIYDRFDHANFHKVSVRSSASAEDGNQHAFAGMLDTFLNIDRAHLLIAIKQCWASLYNERCLTYQLAKQLDRNIGIAVIVQEMIDSEFSGVIFSKDPSVRINQTLIEFVEGLGEGLVSGQKTPHQIIVKDEEVHVADLQLYERIKDQVAELCQAVKRIKKYCQCEVDVEFAIANNKLYFLQCRPVTADSLANVDFNKQWEFYVNRKFCYLFETFQKKAFDRSVQKKILGFSIKTENYLILDGREYYLQTEHDANLKRFDRLFEENNDFFHHYAKKIFAIIEETQHYADYVKSFHYKDFTNQELIKELKKFEEIYLCAVVPTFARPDDYLEQKFTRQLDANLALSAEQKEEILSAIVYYPQDYPALAYTEAIHSIVEIAKETQDVTPRLNEHIRKFAWMKGPLYKKLQTFTRNDYLKDIEKLRTKNETQAVPLRSNQLDNALELLKNYPQTLRLFQDIRDFIYLRTKLSETSDHLFYVVRTTLLKEVARRLAFHDSEIVAMGIEEMIQALRQQPRPIYDIQNRRNCFVFIKSDGKWSEYSGKAAKQLISCFEAQKQPTRTHRQNELHGKIATQGRVVGKVKIIRTMRDLEKVEINDIIVSSMTTPEFTSAIEQASGFITDEGGITCHAAIISREFHIPCIVGTKIATSTLKDGQIVELDAFNGVVRF